MYNNIVRGEILADNWPSHQIIFEDVRLYYIISIIIELLLPLVKLYNSHSNIFIIIADNFDVLISLEIRLDQLDTSLLWLQGLGLVRSWSEVSSGSGWTIDVGD